MRTPTTSGGPPPAPAPLRPVARDPKQQLERTHRQRLGLVYLPLEAVLTPLHLALCAAFLRPWAALANVVFFGQELLRVLLLAIRLKIGVLEALGALSAAFVALPATGTEWLALLLVYLARALAVWTRYRCSFGAAERRPGLVTLLVLGHGVAGLLISLAFLLRAGGPGGAGLGSALMLPHHASLAVVVGVTSAVYDAYGVFYHRGRQSESGEGPFRRPPPPQGHRLLARGFDQGLFEVRHFVGADATTLDSKRRGGRGRRSSNGKPAAGGVAVPVPRYARMLFPPLPEPPHDLPFFIRPGAPEWVKAVGRVVLKRAWLLFEASEAAACLRRAVLTCLGAALLVGPFEYVLGVLGELTGALPPGHDDYTTVGSILHWGVLSKVASTALSLSLAVYSGLALSTLLLYHILAQPVDFSNFSDDLGPVLQHWLEKGWTVALQDARAPSTVTRRRQRQGDELGEEELWREALEDSQRVLHRVAVLSGGGGGAGAAAGAGAGAASASASFPPQVTAPGERRLSVADRLYRAHAFMDLAILAHTSAGRRRGVFADLRAWNDACRPCLAVVNALTLQLELQMEAGARVEGGAKSPLAGVHSRLGLAEPRDAQGVARLMVEAEVQRRLEAQLLARHKPPQGAAPAGMAAGGDGGGATAGGPAAAAAAAAAAAVAAAAAAVNAEGYLLPPRALRPLRLPLLDLQVVEMAALALAALYRQAVAADGRGGGGGGGNGGFEDGRGASRHSIPAVLAALLSCQLAVHLYSSVALQEPGGGGGDGVEGPRRGKGAGGGGVRFTVMRDRPSVVLPQFCDVSAALDRAVEQIVVCYYDSDFASFAFAPLYARLIKMYLENLREKEVEVGDDEGVGDEGVGYVYGGGQRGLLSPSSPPRRRG